MADKFSTLVQWSDEDQCFIALVPEIEGLNAFGDTASEALEQLEVAKNLLFEAWGEKGIASPEPRKAGKFSGQVRLRMPPTLHAKLSRSAELDGVSLNQYMVMLLSEQNERRTLFRLLASSQTASIQALSNSTASFETLYDAFSKPHITAGASSKKVVQ